MKYISIFLTIVLSSCAAVPENREDELRLVFDKLKQETNATDEYLSSYFTSNMWHVLLEARNNPQNQQNASVESINNFPNEITVTGSMESIDDWKGYLIVQGNNRLLTISDYAIPKLDSNPSWTEGYYRAIHENVLALLFTL